jgi:4-hydroxybenzoate polyprenyltransferase
MYHLLLSLRPRQWVKNLFVLAALIFSRHLLDIAYLGKAIAAVGCFLAVSGAVYLLNDVLDREKDRLHPEKKARPVAAGTLSVATALVSASLLMVLGIWGAYQLRDVFGHVVFFYAALNVLYSWRLKDLVLIDVIMVATGFLLRALGGAVVIEVAISTWLILCTFTLTLFLATVKRRQELVRLGEGASGHRPSLGGYGLPYLDQVISILTSATLVCYALYAMGVGEAAEASRQMQWTIPFVLYGILRYLYVVYHAEGGEDPTAILWQDRPLQVTLLLWLLTGVVALYAPVW